MDPATANSGDQGQLQVIDGGKSSPKGSKGWGVRVRRRAKELIQELDTGYMEMAQLLYDIFDTPIDGVRDKGPIFKSWGFDTFKDFVEEDLGMNVRKAERLRAIWYMLEIELVGLDPGVKDRLIKLGVSKLRELVKILDLNNAEAWLGLAERQSYPNLCASIRKAKEEADIKRLQSKVNSKQAATGTSDADVETAGGAGQTDAEAPAFSDEDGEGDGDEDGETPKAGPPEEPEELEFEHFAFYAEQHLNVKLALKKASELSGSDKKSNNLDLICTDFLANNDITPGNKAASVAKFMAHIERVFNVKVIALDESNSQIVYGVETLERLVEK